MSPENTSESTGVSGRLISRVVSAGILGGLLSTAFTFATKTSAEPFNAVTDLLLAATLGGGSAFVFVFLFANTDRRDLLRIAALALVAGFFWKPVYEGAGAFVNASLDQREYNQAVTSLEAATAISDSIRVASPGRKDALVSEFNAKMAQFSRSVAEIDRVSLRQSLAAPSSTLIASVEELPEAQSRAVSTGLAQDAIETARFHALGLSGRSNLLHPGFRNNMRTIANPERRDASGSEIDEDNPRR